MSKFVLGGGISGLIFSYYNPEFTIISPDIGGQLMNGVYNMTWLHRTSQTEELIKELGLDYEIHKTQIGYYSNGEIFDACSSEMNSRIIKRKMSMWNDTDDNFKVLDTTLSVPENFIDTISIDFLKVIDKLKTKVKFIEDKIIEIDLVNRLRSSTNDYRYDELVSTIPANLFWLIYKGITIKPTLNSIPVTFVVTKIPPVWYNNQFEMIYISDSQFYTRVSKRDNDYVFEFTGVMPKEVFEKLYPDCKIEKYFINRSGRIITSENKPPQDNIHFLGRFAEHSHPSKIQDVIRFSKDYKLNK